MERAIGVYKQTSEAEVGERTGAERIVHFGTANGCKIAARAMKDFGNCSIDHCKLAVIVGIKSSDDA